MFVLSLLIGIINAMQSTSNIYPVEGFYFQHLHGSASISNGSQFYIQEVLTYSSAFQEIVSSNIVDISEGTLIGNQECQTPFVGILYQFNEHYLGLVQEIDPDGIVNQFLIGTSILKSNYQCYNILLIGMTTYIQCAQIQNGNIVVFYQSENMAEYNTLQTNLQVNSLQLIFSDLSFFQNSTGEYLISIIVSNLSNIYYIPLLEPSNTINVYNSANIYQQIQYLPYQNVLMLLSNEAFFLLINNDIVINNSLTVNKFSYNLQKDQLILALVNSTNIWTYEVNIYKQYASLLDIMTIQNQNQQIDQVFLNYRYLILSGNYQLEVHDYTTKQSLVASLVINQLSIGFFLGQSNYIGMILINNTQLAIQINQLALICQSCSGNGTFNLTIDEQSQNINYFTLQDNDPNIYRINNISSNYTINYPTKVLYQLDVYVGSNVSIDISYVDNPNLIFSIKQPNFQAINTQQIGLSFVGISFVPQILTFIQVIKTTKALCANYGTLVSQIALDCPASKGYTIYSAIYYQASTYQTQVYLNIGNSLMNVNISLLSNTSSMVTLGNIIKVSNDNIIGMSLQDSILYMLIPYQVLIYDLELGLQLQQTFQLNLRNVWTSYDYPGFVFFDNFTELLVYKFQGSEYLQILKITYQISNTTSAQVGLLWGGIYLLLLNSTNQGLYFYNRQNIQMVQMNQIPFLQIPVTTKLSTITAFTSEFFYISIVNNNCSELSIYQASESSFNSLYKSMYISNTTITQISCAMNSIELYDVCQTLWSSELQFEIIVPHIVEVALTAQYLPYNLSTNLNISLYNAYTNLTSNMTVDYNNPLINIWIKEPVQQVTINQTSAQISINPQQYFSGNIQNYSIFSNNSNVTINNPITQLANYSWQTYYSIQTQGHIYLAGFSAIYITNGSTINQIYSGSSKIIILFTEVNTGYPAWVSSNKTGLFFYYYNLTTLNTSTIQILNINIADPYAFYYGGPLLLASDYITLYCFDITLIQNQITVTQTINSYDLDQSVIGLGFKFQIDENCYGFIDMSYLYTLNIITIVKQAGSLTIYQDTIKFQPDQIIYYPFLTGQQIPQVFINDSYSQISCLFAGNLFYQLNLGFLNYRYISYEITNQYYYLSLGDNSLIQYMAISQNVVLLSSYVQKQSSLLSLYPLINETVNYLIPTLSYLNSTYAKTVAQTCLQFVSENIAVYSINTETFIYQIYDQLTIDYSLTQNQSNLLLTAQNQYSAQSQNITINIWQPSPTPPTPTPPNPIPVEPANDPQSHFWLIIWISLGVLVILIIIALSVYFLKRKSAQKDPELGIQLNPADYERL